MKVIWGKFGTGVDLILCVIINYYVVSIWVNGKDEFHAYSLKDVGVKTINKFNPIPYSTLKNSYFVVYRRGLGNI